MKVLMLSKACVVGVYQRKLEELAARGVDLTVVVPPYWKDVRGVTALEKKFLRGYRLVVAPMRFNGHFHIHYYPTLSQILRAVRPDIVHVDEEPWDFVTYHAVRHAVTVGARPLFFTWQNLLRRYPPPFSGFERYSFHRCADAIAGNADAVSVLRAKGYRGAVSVIPQFGVDTEMFCPHRLPLPRSINPEPMRDFPQGRREKVEGNSLSRAAGEGWGGGNAFTIAYAGRLVREKGVDVLLRAVANLHGDWRLRLLGAGPESARLRRLVAQHRLSERVCFEPQIPSGQMPEFYATIDLLVLPSRHVRNWTEQFGRVLIEAMACGVPVIGSRCGEIPNVIGDAGLIFPEGDAEALRMQIARVMNDEALRDQLRAHGRARALERFTQASVARRTVEVYKKMMV